MIGQGAYIWCVVGVVGGGFFLYCGLAELVEAVEGRAETIEL